MPGSSPLSYLSSKTAVKPSPIHGKGLFAIAPIRKGEIVCIKGGHNFTREHLVDLNARLGPAEISIADGLFIGPMTEEDEMECQCGVAKSQSRRTRDSPR